MSETTDKNQEKAEAGRFDGLPALHPLVEHDDERQKTHPWTHKPMAPLYLVVTVPEACTLFRKSRKTIMMRIWRDDVRARKSGSTWLVAFDDLYALYGDDPR